MEGGEGGEPSEGGNKKGKGAESGRTARRVDPDRGAGASSVPTPLIFRRQDPDWETVAESGPAPERADPDAGQKDKGSKTSAASTAKTTGRWSKEAQKNLRRMGDELREGNAAGAGYVLIHDTARGSAENAWKVSKWGARTGWKLSKWGAQEGKRFYKWLEHKIDDPPSLLTLHIISNIFATVSQSNDWSSKRRLLWLSRCTFGTSPLSV